MNITLTAAQLTFAGMNPERQRDVMMLVFYDMMHGLLLIEGSGAGSRSPAQRLQLAMLIKDDFAPMLMEDERMREALLKVIDALTSLM